MSQFNTPRQQAIARCGNWLYWVAGLSLINAILSQTGSKWGFALGLGITELLSYIAKEGGPVLALIALPVTIGICVVMGLLGYFACRAHRWAFIVGIVLLTLDTALLCIDIGGQILSLLFHGWAIYSLISGLKWVKMPEPAPIAEEVDPSQTTAAPVNPDPFAKNE
jgi:hypothetical protein